MFKSYAEANNTPQRATKTLCRLWQRPEGKYSSGNSEERSTFWLVDNDLFTANKSGARFDECKQVASLSDHTINRENATPIHFLSGYLDGDEIQVRVNTLEQKKARVELAKVAGRETSIDRQPTLYVLKFSTHDLEATSETPEMPF